MSHVTRHIHATCHEWVTYYKSRTIDESRTSHVTVQHVTTHTMPVTNKLHTTRHVCVVHVFVLFNCLYRKSKWFFFWVQVTNSEGFVVCSGWMCFICRSLPLCVCGAMTKKIQHCVWRNTQYVLCFRSLLLCVCACASKPIFHWEWGRGLCRWNIRLSEWNHAIRIIAYEYV